MRFYEVLVNDKHWLGFERCTEGGHMLKEESYAQERVLRRCKWLLVSITKHLVGISYWVNDWQLMCTMVTW